MRGHVEYRGQGRLDVCRDIYNNRIVILKDVGFLLQGCNLADDTHAGSTSKLILECLKIPLLTANLDYCNHSSKPMDELRL